MYNWPPPRRRVLRRHAERQRCRRSSVTTCASTPRRHQTPRPQANKHEVLTSGGKPPDIDCETNVRTSAVDAPQTLDRRSSCSRIACAAAPSPPSTCGGSAAILLASVAIVRLALRGARRARRRRPYVDLFFMGAGVPVAGDQERRAVRAAVRHDPVRELAGGSAGILPAVLACASRRAAKGGSFHWPIDGYAPAAGLLLPWRGWSRPDRLWSLSTRLPRFFASVLVAFAPVPVANLIFAGPVPGCGGLDDRLRCESCWGRCRAGCSSTLAIDHRLPRVAVRGRRILYGLAYTHGAPGEISDRSVAAAGAGARVGAPTFRRPRLPTATARSDDIPIHTTAPAIRPRVRASSS